MIHSLRRKIVAVIMLLVLVFFAVLDTVLPLSSRQMLLNTSLETLKQALNDPYLYAQSSNSKILPTSQSFFVIDVSDNGMVAPVNFGYFGLLSSKHMRSIGRRIIADPADIGTLPDLALRYAKKPIADDAWRVACISIQTEQQTLHFLSITLIIVTVLGIIGFFFLAWNVAVVATRPVEESMRLQRQLVADASHELKTPLTVILTCTELLRSRGPTTSPEQQARWEESIQDEALQMKQMVEDLLFLARVDEGRVEQPQRPVDLSDLVSAEALRFEPVFFEAELLFQWSVAPSLCLQGNADQLRRLCAILLENALKYTTPHGRVDLTLLRQDEDAVQLSVTSDGAPIPKENLEKLFDRFYRGDPARSARNGHGLGLSIARSIVESHRGKIWAESVGGRNRFIVLLPELEP